MSDRETAPPAGAEPFVDVLVRTYASANLGLTERIEELVTAAVTVLGVDSVGVMLLAGAGQPHIVGGSDSLATALERTQIGLGEGPGMDTLRTGTTVAVEDIATRPEYARLWQQAVPHGLHAVLSSSIFVGADIVGNLNAMSREAHGWTQAQVRANDAYAQVVGVALGATVRALEGSRQIDQLHAKIALTGPLQELSEGG